MNMKEPNGQTNRTERRKRHSWRSIVGGDILTTALFQNQGKMIALIMLLVLFYINNRYACQQQLIEIDKLKKELTDVKYDALTLSSELMEKSRQSRIEEYIASKNSQLGTATKPPYLIREDQDN